MQYHCSLLVPKSMCNGCGMRRASVVIVLGVMTSQGAGIRLVDDVLCTLTGAEVITSHDPGI